MSVPSNAPPSGNPATNPQLSYNEPAQVEVSSPPVQTETKTGLSLPPPRLGPQTTTTYESPSQTAARNATDPFLKITGPSGSVVAYAEYGKLVSQSQFESDISAQNQTTTTTSTYYTYQGKKFTDITDLQSYVRSEYPNATIIPVLKPDIRFDGGVGSPVDSSIVGFKIILPATPSFANTQGNTVDQIISDTNVLAPSKGPSGVLGSIENTAATAYSDIGKGFTDLFLGGAAAGRYVATGGKSSTVVLTPDQSSRLSLVTANASYILPGGAILHGIGTVNEPIAARVFDVAVGILPFIPGTGLGGSVVKITGTFAGRTVIGAGIGLAGGLAYGESGPQLLENTIASAVLSGVGGSVLGKLIGTRVNAVEEETGPKLFAGSGRNVLRTETSYGQGGYSQTGVYAVRDPTTGEVLRVETIDNPAMAGLAKSDLVGQFERITGSQLDVKDLPGIQARFTKQFLQTIAQRAEDLGAGGPGEADFEKNLISGMQEQSAEEATKPIPDYIRRTLHPEEFVGETLGPASTGETSIFKSGSASTGLEFRSGKSTVVLRPPEDAVSSTEQMQRSIDKAYAGGSSYRFRRGRPVFSTDYETLVTPMGFVLQSPSPQVLDVVSRVSTRLRSSSVLNLNVDVGLRSVLNTDVSLSTSQIERLTQVTSQEQVQRQTTRTTQTTQEVTLESLVLGGEVLAGIDVGRYLGLNIPASSTKTKRKRKSKRSKGNDFIRPNQLSLNILEESLPFELKGLL